MPFMWAHWLCQCAQTSAAMLLAGTATLRLLARGTGGERLALWRYLAGASGCVLCAAALIQLGLTAANMSGLPLLAACSREVLANVLGTTVFGSVWKWRMGLLGAALALHLWVDRARWRRRSASSFPGPEILGALLAAGLLCTVVWGGHARASDRHGWLLPADLVHALAAGVWPGGLLPLALLLARTHREPELISTTVRVTRRYSGLSVGAVGTLVTSGILNSVGLLGSLTALWVSAYGRLILCKVALLAAMVSLGFINRRMIRRVDPASASKVLQSLWQNVAWETALAVGVLLATEALTMTPPPASGG